MHHIPTKDMSREEWLALRRKSLGGTDAAAVVGLSKWSTPYTVWADKTGRLPGKEESEAMRIGRDLEDYVAKRWCEVTGKKVRRENFILYNDKYPFAHANVDRMVVGENAGLECKTTSTLNVHQFKGQEFPEKYYAQCVHYMAVTGADRWYLAVLVLGREFYAYTLERDEAEINALMSAEAEFWKLVESDTPPTPDGEEPTTDAITTIYAESRDNTAIDLFGREALLREYMDLKASKAAVEARLAEIQNTICADMQDAERGSCGTYDVRWKTQTRKTFQPKAFAEAYPTIDLSPFYKVSTSRPFVVKEKTIEEEE